MNILEKKLKATDRRWLWNLREKNFAANQNFLKEFSYNNLVEKSNSKKWATAADACMHLLPWMRLKEFNIYLITQKTWGLGTYEGGDIGNYSTLSKLTYLGTLGRSG